MKNYIRPALFAVLAFALVLPIFISPTYAATIYGEGNFTGASATGDASTYSKDNTPTYTFTATNTSGSELTNVKCVFTPVDLNGTIKYPDYIDFISGTATVGGSTYAISKASDPSGWYATSEEFSVPNGTSVLCSIKIKILNNTPTNPDIDPLGYAKFPLEYGIYGWGSTVYADSSIKVIQEAGVVEALTLSVTGSGLYKDTDTATFKSTIKNISSVMVNTICGFAPGEITGTGYGNFYDYMEFSSAKATVGTTSYTVNKVEDTSKPGFWKLESAIFQLPAGGTAICEFNVKIKKEAPLKLDTAKLGYMSINIGMTASKSDGSSYKSETVYLKIENESLAAVASIKLPSIFGGDTTNFSNLTDESAKKIEDFTLEVVGKGKIVYKETVNLSGDAIIVRMEKLDEYVMINSGSVEVKTDRFSELNKPATVYLYGLNLVKIEELPFTIYNDGKASSGAVSNVRYENKVLSFDVTGFSRYSFVPGISYEYERVDGKLKVDGFVNDLDAIIKLIAGDKEVVLEVSDDGSFKGEIDADSGSAVKLLATGISGDKMEKLLEGESGSGKSAENEKLFLGLDSVSWMLIGGGFLIFMGGFTFIAYKKGWLKKWMEAGKKFGEKLRVKFSKKGAKPVLEIEVSKADIASDENLGTNKVTTKTGDEITFNEVKDN
ncbi:hypothetical protein JW962_00780 [Candidatus Dojkabacteria bacterium]|nr:hypothetical protein [Candidatus Dojkabacteria bacterium]